MLCSAGECSALPAGMRGKDAEWVGLSPGLALSLECFLVLPNRPKTALKAPAVFPDMVRMVVGGIGLVWRAEVAVTNGPLMDACACAAPCTYPLSEVRDSKGGSGEERDEEALAEP